jgi:hypothetical protein
MTDEGVPDFGNRNTLGIPRRIFPLFDDNISRQSIAEPNTILRGLVRSTVHGLVLSGTYDRVEMGVCAELRRHVVGLGKFAHQRASS